VHTVEATTRNPELCARTRLPAMEIEGHPTQDLVEELERRGAVRMAGSTDGPHPDALRFLQESRAGTEGFWVFLPDETFMTGFDDLPT
jgi:hypothetical protein